MTAPLLLAATPLLRPHSQADDVPMIAAAALVAFVAGWLLAEFLADRRARRITRRLWQVLDATGDRDGAR
jgi:hypothetical protein